MGKKSKYIIAGVLIIGVIIIFFNANGTFFKRDKIIELISVIKINHLLSLCFFLLVAPPRRMVLYIRFVNLL